MFWRFPHVTISELRFEPDSYFGAVMTIRPLQMFVVIAMLQAVGISLYAHKKKEDTPLNKIKISYDISRILPRGSQ